MQPHNCVNNRILLHYALNPFFRVFKIGFPSEKEKMDIYFCPFFSSDPSFFFTLFTYINLNCWITIFRITENS